MFSLIEPLTFLLFARRRIASVSNPVVVAIGLFSVIDGSYRVEDCRAVIRRTRYAVPVNVTDRPEPSIPSLLARDGRPRRDPGRLAFRNTVEE